MGGLRWQEDQTTSTKKIYWKFTGEGTLPPGTLVVLHVFFQDKKIVERNAHILGNGKLLCLYGPMRGRLPYGKYHWELVYQKTNQAANMLHRLQNVEDFNLRQEFRRGTALDIIQETQERVQFYQSLLGEGDTLLSKIAKESEEWLTKKPLRLSDIEKWQDKKTEEVQAFRNKVKEWKKAWVFPVVEKLPEAEMIAACVESLWFLHLENVSKYHKVPFSFAYQSWRNQQDVLHTDFYRDQMAQAAQTITAWLPIPQNWNEAALEKYLLCFNQLFREMRQQYLSMTPKDLDTWLARTSEWGDDLTVFAKKAEEYAQSPLHHRYPSLAKDLAMLIPNSKELMASYTVALYKKAKKDKDIPTELKDCNIDPNEALANLQKKFAEVYQIIANKAEQNKAEEKRLWEELQQAPNYLQGLRQTLDEGLKLTDKESFGRWQQSWSEQSNALNQKRQSWAISFPQEASLVAAARSALEDRAGLHHDFVTGQKGDRTVDIQDREVRDVLIRQMEIQWQRAMRILEAALEKSKKAGRN